MFLSDSSSKHAREEKDGPDNHRGHTKRTKKPGEPGLYIDSRERKVQRGSHSGLELRESHHDRLHALWRLRERVLE